MRPWCSLKHLKALSNASTPAIVQIAWKVNTAEAKVSLVRRCKTAKTNPQHYQRERGKNSSAASTALFAQANPRRFEIHTSLRLRWDPNTLLWDALRRLSRRRSFPNPTRRSQVPQGHVKMLRSRHLHRCHARLCGLGAGRFGRGSRDQL